MAAIGASDDLHAWLIRGFIEAGLPDVTFGGEVPVAGGVNWENLYLNRGVEGVLLCFPGFEPGSEWIYGVAPAGGANAVHVRCRDTLFSQSYAGLPPPQLAGRILADVRAHNEAFVAWRAQGNEPGMVEMRAIGDARGVACGQALASFLEPLQRARQPLSEGPAQGWWVAGMTRKALGAQIAMGAGADPTYRLAGEVPLHDRPEYRIYAEQVKTVGGVMMAVGAVSFIVAGLTLAWAGYNVFQQRAEVVLSSALSRDVGPIALFLAASVFAVTQVLAGWRMRVMKNLLLVRICAGFAILPCSGACWIVGLPVGGWALWTLADEKAKVLFDRG
jgi:hypothetical protein